MRVAVDRRVLVTSLVVAAAVSVTGGWALSRADGTGDAGVVDLGAPGTTQLPTIGTNAQNAGRLLPDVALEGDGGVEITTVQLLGQPLVLNYWFSTCAPCERELPAFAAVHADYGDRVRFVGVNPFDTAEVNRRFAEERGVRYELLRDRADAFGSALGVSTAPFTVFVAADGTIVRQTGVLDEDDLRRMVEELLA